MIHSITEDQMQVKNNFQDKGTKCPINLSGLSYQDLRLLAIWLHLKSISTDGLLSKSHLREHRYWLPKLEKRQLVKQCNRNPGKYLLRGYRGMCRVLGVRATQPKNKMPFTKCWHVHLNFKTKKEFLNYLVSEKAETLKKQLLYSRIRRRARNRAKITHDVALSASTVARFFGYKSKSSGGRKRKKFFKLIGKPELDEPKYFPEIDPERALKYFFKPRIVRI